MGCARVPNRAGRLILTVGLAVACEAPLSHTVSVRVGLHPEYGEQEIACETHWLQASLKPRDIGWADPWQLITTQTGPILLEPYPAKGIVVATGEVPAGDYTHLFLDLGRATEAQESKRQIVDIVEPIAAPFITKAHQHIELTLWLMLRDGADSGSSLQLFAIDTEASTHD